MRRPLLLAALLLLQTACSTFETDPIPPEYRRPALRYFVENHGNDRRNLDRFIALALRRHGLDAEPAPVRTRRDPFDVLVVYEDRWTWSTFGLANYLSFLRIDLRDPKTNVLLATGSVYRSSVARTNLEKVIEAVVANLFR